MLLRVAQVSCRRSAGLKLPTTTLLALRFNSQVASTPEAFLERSKSDPHVSFLNLNRPSSRNAISQRLLKEFYESLCEVEHDKSTRILIVRSTSDGMFCAGADLVERRTMSKIQVLNFLKDLRRSLTALEKLDIPTIAAIDGPALGGGLELALACDFRVASSTVTKIGLPETQLGIIPGAGGTQRLTRLLGVAKAKDMILTGRILTAQEAKALGVLDYVAENDPSVAPALHLARRVLRSAPLALAAAKKAINGAVDVPLEMGLNLESDCYRPLLDTNDRLEALAAFKEKRLPVFKGE